MIRSFLFATITLIFTACTPNLGPMVHKSVTFKKITPSAERSLDIYKLSDTELQKKYPKAVRISTIQSIDLRYMLEQDASTKEQTITVRGTANLANALQDAEYFDSRNKKIGIYVHNGFDNDTQTLYNDILPHLNKEYKTKLTGHSLGAAIAALLMIYLDADNFTLLPSYNFGQPKFTNAAGAKKYQNMPMLRVVHDNDIVPLVPPVTLLDSIHGAYEHIAAEVILLKSVYYSYLTKHQSQKASVDEFWRNLGDMSVADHNMYLYLDSIKAKEGKEIEIPYSEREKYIAQ